MQRGLPEDRRIRSIHRGRDWCRALGYCRVADENPRKEFRVRLGDRAPGQSPPARPALHTYRSDEWQCIGRFGREWREYGCNLRLRRSRSPDSSCCTLETPDRKNNSTAFAAKDFRQLSPCCAIAGWRPRAALHLKAGNLI